MAKLVKSSVSHSKEQIVLLEVNMVVFNQETASGIVSRIKIFKVFNCADII